MIIRIRIRIRMVRKDTNHSSWMNWHPVAMQGTIFLTIPMFRFRSWFRLSRSTSWSSICIKGWTLRSSQRSLKATWGPTGTGQMGSIWTSTSRSLLSRRGLCFSNLITSFTIISKWVSTSWLIRKSIIRIRWSTRGLWKYLIKVWRLTKRPSIFRRWKIWKCIKKGSKELNPARRSLSEKSKLKG